MKRKVLSLSILIAAFCMIEVSLVASKSSQSQEKKETRYTVEQKVEDSETAEMVLPEYINPKSGDHFALSTAPMKFVPPLPGSDSALGCIVCSGTWTLPVLFYTWSTPIGN